MARPDLISTKRTCQKVGDCSTTWLKRAQKSLAFPLPEVKGSGRGPDLYDEAKVDAWVEQYIEKKRAGPAPTRPNNIERSSRDDARPPA